MWKTNVKTKKKKAGRRVSSFEKRDSLSLLLLCLPAIVKVFIFSALCQMLG